MKGTNFEVKGIQASQTSGSVRLRRFELEGYERSIVILREGNEHV